MYNQKLHYAKQESLSEEDKNYFHKLKMVIEYDTVREVTQEDGPKRDTETWAKIERHIARKKRVVTARQNCLKMDLNKLKDSFLQIWVLPYESTSNEEDNDISTEEEEDDEAEYSSQSAK